MPTKTKKTPPVASVAKTDDQPAQGMFARGLNTKSDPHSPSAISPSPSPSEIPLDEIVLHDRSTQLREGAGDGDQIDNLREAYEAGAAVPPIVLFAADVSGTYYIGDGWHRVFAQQGMRGRKTVRAIVRPGGVEAAFRHACGANAAHGLRRTNADKRKAVTAALAKWPDQSDRAISDICMVDHKTVGARREELGNFPGPRVGRDGKSRKLPEKPPGGQVDFWNVFRSDLSEYIGSIERCRTNQFFGEKMIAEPDRAAEELESTAEALANEAREMRSLAKAIRSGQADIRKGGSV